MEFGPYAGRQDPFVDVDPQRVVPAVQTFDALGLESISVEADLLLFEQQIAPGMGIGVGWAGRRNDLTCEFENGRGAFSASCVKRKIFLTKLPGCPFG